MLGAPDELPSVDRAAGDRPSAAPQRPFRDRDDLGQPLDASARFSFRVVARLTGSETRGPARRGRRVSVAAPGVVDVVKPDPDPEIRALRVSGGPRRDARRGCEAGRARSRRNARVSDQRVARVVMHIGQLSVHAAASWVYRFVRSCESWDLTARVVSSARISYWPVRMASAAWRAMSRGSDLGASMWAVMSVSM